METLHYNDIIIELSDVDSFSEASSDNSVVYDFKYYAEQRDDFVITTTHSVILKRSDLIIKSAVLFGGEGLTRIHETSALIDNHCLLICVSNFIFCLTLPDLNLLWTSKADEATCFQILKLNGGYLVHGELSVSKLNRNGQIEWQFYGKDIFVTPDSESEVEISENKISLVDWSNNTYLLDFNGRRME